jgi:peptidoglycan/xylan/chitin deacetylase (PgdA/CDA1 family)
MTAALHVVMYHYIRDLPNTPFPRIKGMLISDFRRQLSILRERFEMATLESALDFIRGDYAPTRDLCLLTFDDGLKEHYTDVTPMLADCGVQGLFFPITWCLHERRVAPVHMNHFMMASLDFDRYRRVFLDRLHERASSARPLPEVDRAMAERTYRWDTPEVASFKYLFNFVVDSDTRDEIVKSVFDENFSDEKSFAGTLYITWEEGRAMQDAGMIIGGHSHQHKPLATLSDETLRWDLTTSTMLLFQHLRPQALWPFSYPYGKKDSFTDAATAQLRHLGFACAFSTEVGANTSGADLFTLKRLDCKDAPKP